MGFGGGSRVGTGQDTTIFLLMNYINIVQLGLFRFPTPHTRAHAHTHAHAHAHTQNA